MKDQIRALVDTSVLALDDLVRPNQRELDRFENKLQVFDIINPGHDERKIENIKSLPTIAKMANAGSLELFKYNWILSEGWAHKGVRNFWPAHQFGRLLDGVRYTAASEPLPMGKFLDVEYNKKNFIWYCKFLLRSDAQVILENKYRNLGLNV